MNLLMLGFALVVTLAVFATTRPGREIAKRIGFRDRVPGAASSEDIGYLLDACGGDRRLLETKLAAERERYPDLTEAEHCRRAIRKVFAERTSSESGTR